MAEQSTIEWTRSTFNPWWGCTKVGPGCDHCYAEGVGGRFGTQWGTGAERRVFGDKHWNEPLRWERKAAAEQAVDPKATWRVFCASMADVFDNDAPAGQRERLWALIEATPHLTWLLLTKRIGNAKKMLPAAWLEHGGWPKNVRLGITVVNQEEVVRDIPKLQALHCPNFLSVEPLLAAIDVMYPVELWPSGPARCCSGYECGCMGQPIEPPLIYGIDWVIVGGESGNGARPMHPDWVRDIRNQCASMRVPFLFKQWGEWLPAKIVGHFGLKVDGTPIGGAFQFCDQSITPHAGYMQMKTAKLDNLHTAFWFGKKIAGRLLDGVQHDGYPEVANG